MEMARFRDTAPLVAPTIQTLTDVAVGDSDLDARTAATGAIAYAGGKEAVTALLTILKQSHDDDVRVVRGRWASGSRCSCEAGRAGIP